MIHWIVTRKRNDSYLTRNLKWAGLADLRGFKEPISLLRY